MRHPVIKTEGFSSAIPAADPGKSRCKSYSVEGIIVVGEADLTYLHNRHPERSTCQPALLQRTYTLPVQRYVTGMLDMRTSVPQIRQPVWPCVLKPRSCDDDCGGVQRKGCLEDVGLADSLFEKKTKRKVT